MAEINLKALVDGHDKTVVRVGALEEAVKETAETLGLHDRFIVYANQQFNGAVDPETGEIQVTGILPRLQALNERLAKVEEKQAAGQPDWFMNANPELAAVWLEEVGVYTDRVVRYVIKEHTKLKLTACWPWHPRVVAELLTSHCHYRAAHRGGIPTPVADLWRQWLDGTVGRVNELLADCQLIHKAELVDTTTGQISREWTVDQAQLPAYLNWWCTSAREGIPPGLRRKT